MNLRIAPKPEIRQDVVDRIRNRIALGHEWGTTEMDDVAGQLMRKFDDDDVMLRVNGIECLTHNQS